MSDDTPKPEVEESGEYENFLGKKATEYMAPSLSDVLGVDQEDLRGSVNPVKEHWVDMPEYEHKKDAGPHKTIYVHFRNEEDYQEFAKLVETGLTKKTKSIWYPKQSITPNSLLRWMQEDSDES
jgi:hypothetical protein|tara:strand:- start:1025 stop:1396 length:372 start_codon:yes stop_codon:yes gene_type:complete